MRRQPVRNPREVWLTLLAIVVITSLIGWLAELKL